MFVRFLQGMISFFFGPSLLLLSSLDGWIVRGGLSSSSTLCLLVFPKLGCLLFRDGLA